MFCYYITHMTPRPIVGLAKDSVLTIRIPADSLAFLREVQQRDGIPVSEQVRRGIKLWLESRGVMKSDRKRVVARKRP